MLRFHTSESEVVCCKKESQVKIIFLTQYYPPEMGAAQARLSELAARFIERGHEVLVLTSMPNYPQGRIYSGYGGLLRREVYDGISVIRTYIYPSKSIGKVRRLANYFSFVMSSLIFGAILLPSADYLLVESPPLFLGISGYVLSRLKRARWIFNVSDLWPESAVHLGIVREGALLRVASAIEAFCYRKAWLVTGQSNEILENIRRRFTHVPVYHLSGGVDTTVFGPGHRTPDTRTELANGHTCIAIYAGLHGIAQGLDQVLDAAARLQDLRKFGIVLVGDGPEKERLVAQARDLGLTNVRFLDAYSRKVMPEVMASADIALVPLKLRLPGAVPSKLYEAMGAGLPVVLIAEGEAAEIVHEMDCGVVVAPGDVDALASTLRGLVENVDKRRDMGIRGRNAAVARFDRDRIADMFIDFLEEKL
jgi:colanic acid biosynthesis glycosyl transferase WcaI